MKKSIHKFEQTEMSLSSLLSLTRSLEELLSALKDMDKNWIDTFRTEWWPLELISSSMMDKEVDNVSKKNQETVSQALQNIKKMIDDALSKQT